MDEKNENMKHSFEVAYTDWLPCFRPYIEIYVVVPWATLMQLPEPENESGMFWWWFMEINDESATPEETPVELECTFGDYPESFHGKLMLISYAQADGKNKVLMIKCLDPDKILAKKILPNFDINKKITLKYR